MQDLNTDITLFFKGIKNKSKKQYITIKEGLEKIYKGIYKDQIENLRQLDADQYKERKKELDYITFSGTFSERKNDALQQHSGFICIDVDDIYNLEQTKEKLANDPYTYAIFLSPSGKGLKLLVKIDPNHHHGSFLFLEHYYQEHYQVQIDQACKDVARACFVSYDPEMRYNFGSEVAPHVDPETGEQAEGKKEMREPVETEFSKRKDEYEREMRRANHVIQQIEENQVDLTTNYDDWLNICFSLSVFGEEGRDLFHRVSQFHPEYNSQDADYKFDDALKNSKFTTPAKFFKIAKDNDLDTKVPKKKPKPEPDTREHVDESVMEEEGVEGIDWTNYQKYGFWEYENAYWCFGKKEKVFKLSNFVMEILYHVETGSHEAYRVIKLTNQFGYERTINMDTDNFVSLQGFRKDIAKLGNFLFYGGEPELFRIQSKLQEEEIKSEEIRTLGFQTDENFWAWSNGIIDLNDQGTFKPVDDFGIIRMNREDQQVNYFIPAYSKMYRHKKELFDAQKRFYHFDGQVSFDQWADTFCRAYGKNGRIGLIFYIQCLFRDIVFDSMRSRFPILNLYGQKGTGKGTMAESLLSMFGQRQDPVMLQDSTSKSIPRKMAQLKNALVFLDEYNNSLHPKIIQAIKTMYDGTSYSRSTIDNSYNTDAVPINSSPILAGQEIPTKDEALFQRCIHLVFQDIKNRPADQKKAFEELINLEGNEGLPQITSYLVRHRDQFKHYFRKVYKEVQGQLSEKINNPDIPDRILNNYSSLLATCRMVSKLENLPFTYDTFWKDVEEAVHYHFHVMKGTDVVASFWEIMETMVSEGWIQEDRDFKLDEGYLYLKVHNVYGRYAKEARQRDEMKLDRGTLEQYLKNSPQFVKQNRKVFSKDGSGSTYSRCYQFHYKDLGVDLIKRQQISDLKFKYEEMGIDYDEQEMNGAGGNTEEQEEPDWVKEAEKRTEQNGNNKSQ